MACGLGVQLTVVIDLVILFNNDNTRFNGHFPGRPGKPVPECQTSLDFVAARDVDGGGSGDSWNSKDMQNSSQITTSIPLTPTLSFCRPDTLLPDK